jgi:hypothetical protein
MKIASITSTKVNPLVDLSRLMVIVTISSQLTSSQEPD